MTRRSTRLLSRGDYNFDGFTSQPVMIRRSPRLLSRGDYNFDGAADLSPTPSVSFRETPVWVCKKKRRTHKTTTSFKGDSSPAGTKSPVTAGQTDSVNNIASCHYKAATKETRHLFLLLLLLLLLVILGVWLLLPLMTALMTEPGPVPGCLTPKLKQALESWLADRVKELPDQWCASGCGRPIADKMADFAVEYQGASVVHSRTSKSYYSCATLFGFPLWYRAKSPRLVIQAFSELLSGRCWPFHGAEGTLFISLSHPAIISHVTLDHLPCHNSPNGRIDSAPKDFEVYAMVSEEEGGTLLGKFVYNKDGDPTQTFELPKPSEVVYRFVKLRVLSNWGQAEYTCIYRFRVHGTMAST